MFDELDEEMDDVLEQQPVDDQQEDQHKEVEEEQESDVFHTVDSEQAVSDPYADADTSGHSAMADSVKIRMESAYLSEDIAALYEQVAGTLDDDKKETESYGGTFGVF